MAGGATPLAQEPTVETLNQLLPFIIPILLIDWTMKIIALVDLARRERATAPKWVWVLVILFVNLVGPIVYFIFGRRD